MAGMNPYTAYEDKPMSAMDIATDVAVAPYKPSTQLWMYTHMPSLWSTTKGVHIPWNIEAGKRTWKAVKAAWGQGRWGVAGLKSLGFAGAVRPFGAGGSRIGASKIPMYERKIKGLESKIQKYSTRKVMTQMEMHQSAIDKAWEHNELFKQQQMASKYKKGRYKYKMKALEKDITTDPKVYKSMIGDLDDKIAGATKGIGRYKNKIFKAKFAKWGIRAGKAASIVGATMFAWDIARMVGEPVGRAIVGQLDTALNEWEDRFMPELGGRLEMTYLTRGAATERQRALQAMSKAQITGRSGFGREAMYAHS